MAGNVERIDVDELVHGAADELGIDVDRFRLGAGATPDNLYLTGLEFALGVATVMVARFLRGVARGAQQRLAERGIEPAKIGETVGAAAADALADRLEGVVKRSEDGLEKPGKARDASVLAELEEVAALPELRAVVADGADFEPAITDVEEFLRDNGIPAGRARTLAERVAGRLTSDLQG